MKISKSKLKKLIKEMAYKLSQDDIDMIKGFDADQRRAVGRQHPREIAAEKAALRDYQKDLRGSSGGKELIEAFMSGNGITTIHAIGLDTFSGNRLGSPIAESSWSDWIQKRGRSGRGTISCSAWLGSPDDIQNIDTGLPMFQEVFETGYGFIMTGYPVLVGEDDLMSQTLRHLPQGLIDDQAGSGVAKRSSVQNIKSSIKTIDHLYYAPEGRAWVPEVLIKGWKIVGVYVTGASLAPEWSDRGGEQRERIRREAEGLGLPLHILDVVTDADDEYWD